MNNDLEQFSEERLKEIAQHGLNRGIYSDDLKSLARIALSVKKSEPIGEIRLSEYRSDGTREASLVCLHDQADWDNFTDGTLLYLNPQPAHTEQDGCQWNRDEDSVYSTGCGNEWQFTEGGIEDNKIKFCPYCSGKIAAPKPESE